MKLQLGNGLEPINVSKKDMDQLRNIVQGTVQDGGFLPAALLPIGLSALAAATPSIAKAIGEWIGSKINKQKGQGLRLAGARGQPQTMEHVVANLMATLPDKPTSGEGLKLGGFVDKTDVIVKTKRKPKIEQLAF